MMNKEARIKTLVAYKIVSLESYLGFKRMEFDISWGDVIRRKYLLEQKNRIKFETFLPVFLWIRLLYYVGSKPWISETILKGRYTKEEIEAIYEFSFNFYSSPENHLLDTEQRLRRDYLTLGLGREPRGYQEGFELIKFLMANLDEDLKEIANEKE